MNFIVDAQLPRRIALWLREHGHDAIHTLELPQANRTTDTAIVRHASPAVPAAEAAARIHREHLHAISMRFQGRTSLRSWLHSKPRTSSRSAEPE